MTTPTSDGSIEKLLGSILLRLNKLDSLNEHLANITAEWYFNVSDLQMALLDGNAWSELKLPGRLKLEMKIELLRLQNLRIEESSYSYVSPVNKITTEKELWTKYFSAEHNAFFYYCQSSDMTQWEVPTGNIEIYDDGTAQSFLYLDDHSSNSSSGGGILRMDSSFDSQVRNDNPTSEGTTTQTTASAGSYTDANLDILVAVNAKKRSAFMAPEDPLNGGYAVGIAMDNRRDSVASFTSESSYDFRNETDTDAEEDETKFSDPDPKMLSRLVDMGFSTEAASRALRRSENNLPSATSILLRSPSLKDYGPASHYMFSSHDQRYLPKTTQNTLNIIQNTQNINQNTQNINQNTRQSPQQGTQQGAHNTHSTHQTRVKNALHKVSRRPSAPAVPPAILLKP
jgi:UBA/TS-N domain